MRGDQQIKGIDFFDSYAPVVSWPVVHLLLTLSILCNLKIQQVDYSSAFAEAEIDDEIYFMLPSGLNAPIVGNIVLKLQK